MSRHGRWISYLMLLFAITPVLAACGGSQPQAAYVPAGAADGLNTFLFLYTDN